MNHNDSQVVNHNRWSTEIEFFQQFSTSQLTISTKVSVSFNKSSGNSRLSRDFHSSLKRQWERWQRLIALDFEWSFSHSNIRTFGLVLRKKQSERRFSLPKSIRHRFINFWLNRPTDLNDSNPLDVLHNIRLFQPEQEGIKRFTISCQYAAASQTFMLTNCQCDNESRSSKCFNLKIQWKSNRNIFAVAASQREFHYCSVEKSPNPVLIIGASWWNVHPNRKCLVQLIKSSKSGWTKLIRLVDRSKAADDWQVN